MKKMTVNFMTRTALLLALTMVVQSLRLQPTITGPLVNFMLIFSTLLVGTAGGVFIGSITPWIALTVGILNPVLAPAVPFIMLGNAVFCLLAGLAANKNSYLQFIAIIGGAVLKFGVIAGAAAFILKLPEPVTQVLMFPQLTNALIGGLVAAKSVQVLKERTRLQSFI
ncbi:MAG TPA: ECF transporter S component [Firmicutes bacterium]|nr:ECF transporter S component [Bacillota bacterium]